MRRLLPYLIMFSALVGAVATDPAADAGRLPQTVRELAERAAGGDAKSLYYLGMMHFDGHDTVPVDTARSVALVRKSAERGYAPAQSWLGWLYFNGLGVRHDVDSAMYWTESAAKLGDARAANNLGWLYMKGEVVPRDTAKARAWFEQAVAAGLPSSQSLLADLLLQSDTVRATELYESAASRGLDDAESKLIAVMEDKWNRLDGDSAVSLGRRYYSEGLSRAAVRLFERGICLGNAAAMGLLGDAYSKGQGVGYDHDRSVEWFFRGALAGDASSQFVIAELLDMFPDALDGNSVAAMFKAQDGADDSGMLTARYWYARAAEQGVTDAATAARKLLEP